MVVHCTFQCFLENCLHGALEKIKLIYYIAKCGEIYLSENRPAHERTSWQRAPGPAPGSRSRRENFPVFCDIYPAPMGLRAAGEILRGSMLINSPMSLGSMLRYRNCGRESSSSQCRWNWDSGFRLLRKRLHRN